jgi:redoxin
VRELHRLYRDRGLVTIGVHTPEFDEEHDVAGVRKAIQRLEIPYLVAIDNDEKIWKSFDNRYWPATYLIGKDGTIVWRHVGELHRDTPAFKEAAGRIEEALGKSE